MARYNFFGGITDWANETQDEVAVESANIAIQVYTMIVDRSPMLTGRFIANWLVGPTDANYSVNSTMSWDAKIADIKSTITKDYFKTHDRVYMVNNLNYVDNVEYTGWANTLAYSPVSKTLKKIGNGFAPVGQTMGAIAGGIV